MRSVHRVLTPPTSPNIGNGCCALAIMTKAPRAGDVKTRLVPPLTHDEAAQLNASFLRDTAAAICSAAAEAGHVWCVGVYTPVGTEHTYADILPLEFGLIPQRGHTFGERLYFGAADLLSCGFQSVCLIDSDSPTIPVETFSHAVKLLQHPGDRVVLGPSDDGGYYLIGLKKLHRKMFEQIEWSTKRVFKQTLRRAKEICVEVKILARGYDVDDPEALRRLCNDLLGEKSSLHSDIAPHTRKFLAGLLAKKKL
jgi:rSAM/selenodomain-associated transferase 1